MSHFKRFLKKYWPVIFLTITSIFIFLANYIPNTYLLGWDNTVPELNLALNLKRTLFGIWQEYRGLGTLDGMAHTANIMHWLYVALLSLILPNNMIRYVFILLTHLVGGIGVYFLVKNEILPTLFKRNQNSLKVTSLIGALIYQFNFMTIQMFYVPLELFTIHFALLPWGVLTLTRYLKTRSNKNLIWFFIINILGVSQAHVPTIVISYIAILSIFLLSSLLINFRKNWKSVLLASLILFASNAFWGMPYIYSTLNKSSEIIQSKQNRLGTPGIFYRNLTWTNLESISTFGGFRIDYLDWDLNKNEFNKILGPWISFYESHNYKIASTSISIFSLIGLLLLIYYSFKYKTKQYLPYIFGWLFAVIMLGTNLPIIKNLMIWLSNNIPLFKQLFRFTFTKFSTIYVFFVSILVSIYLNLLVKIKINKTLLKATYVGIIFLIFYLAHPIFNGYFFYPALKVKLPSQYSELTTYIDKEFPNSRIISFPIHSLWGWTTSTNTWGYRGSGFTWQMVEQPFIDRSFDPWSKYNETMFLQTNLALYTQDKSRLTGTLNKYHTNLILNDNSIFHPGNYPENLFSKETYLLFDQTTQIDLNKESSPLELYELSSTIKNTQLYAPKQINTLSNDYAHTYTSIDQAYINQGEYVLDSNPNLSYPFSHLQQEQINSPKIIDNHLVYNLNINTAQQLELSKFSEIQKQVVGAITAKIKENQLIIKTQIQVPKIIINNQSPTFHKEEIELPIHETSNYTIKFNNKEITINPQKLTKESTIITYLFLPTQENIEGIIVNDKQQQVANYELPINKWINEIDTQLTNTNLISEAKIIISLGENEEFIFKNNPNRSKNQIFNCSKNQEGKASKSIFDGKYIYSAENKGIFCDTYYFPELNEELQYIFHWEGNVESGSGVRGFLLNPDTKRFDLNIGSNQKSFDEWYTVYPSKNIYKQSSNKDFFGFSINGESYGESKNQLNLQSLEFYSLPLNWLTSIFSQTETPRSFDTQIDETNKIGTVFYSTNIDVKTPTGIIVLPQSYDKGWILLKWPLEKNFKHLVFNGWANGWEIPNGKYKIIIFYWPQLLVFGGYTILVGTGTYLTSVAVKKRKHTS